MLRYILKRLIAGVLTVIVLITISFFLMHMMPGGPFSPSEQKNVPPELLARVAAKYGLDRPVGEQYIEYWKNLLRGDFGISYKKLDTTVNETIAYGFPISMRVGLVAVILSLVVGIPLGVIAAIRRAKLWDLSAMAFATIGISVPVFVISILLMYLFAGVLQWLPTYGLASWRHYILPVACLTFTPIAYIARQTRSSMLEALEQDYVRTARAKGHALRNALIPFVTIVVLALPGLFAGAIITETVFAWPGMGRLYYDALQRSDWNVALAFIFITALLTVIATLIGDILYTIVDPRIKFS